MGALRQLGQDDLDVEANLGYLVRSRLRPKLHRQEMLESAAG